MWRDIMFVPLTIQNLTPFGGTYYAYFLRKFCVIKKENRSRKCPSRFYAPGKPSTFSFIVFFFQKICVVCFMWTNFVIYFSILDWGALVDVVGFCFLDLGINYQPQREFADWIKLGPKPIYIGFGSMVSILLFMLATLIIMYLYESVSPLMLCSWLFFYF